MRGGESASATSLDESVPLLHPQQDDDTTAATTDANDLETRVVAPNNRKQRVNHNVVLALIVVAIVGTAESVWASTVMVAFLNVLTGKNDVVGFVEASQGITQLVTAIPVGYFADKYSRSKVVSVGGVLMFLAATVIAYAVVRGEQGQKETSTTLLFISLAVWGIVTGIITGPVQALYADSIPQGERSRYYVYLFVVYLLGMTCGPATSIVLFALTDDRWHLTELRNVIIVGLGIELIAGILMFFFDDKKALHADRDQGLQDDKNVATALSRKHAKYVPYLLFGTSLVMALGSGMTIKFFPLFFKNDCHLSPKEVQGIFLAVPLANIVSAITAQRISKVLGRIQTTMLFRGSGAAALFAMVYLQKYRSDWRVMAPLFVFRSALMRAVYPLEESVLMDFVPKDERARWKTLESVAQFGWCGSAALGGVLSDRHGYSFAFLITACVQACSVVFYLPLLWIVPRREKLQPEETTATN